MSRKPDEPLTPFENKISTYVCSRCKTVTENPKVTAWLVHFKHRAPEDSGFQRCETCECPKCGAPLRLGMVKR